MASVVEPKAYTEESACGRSQEPLLRRGRNVTLLPTDCMIERPETHHRDCVLTEYKPRCNPNGHLHNATLLRYLLRHENLLANVWPIIERTWAYLGYDQTVWGAKWTKTGFHSFELYFYNPAEASPRKLRSVSNLKSVLRPWLDHIGQIDDRCDYKMCSFDIDASFRETQRVSSAHVYVASGNLDQRLESFSYGLHADGIRLENHYLVLLTKEGLSEMRRRLRWSPHATTDAARLAVLPPKLRRCFRIHYAVKPTCDGFYFNRITTAQTIWFAQQYLPKHVAQVLVANATQFSHLLWDVAFDFGMSRDRRGAVDLKKFGIYGCV